MRVPSWSRRAASRTHTHSIRTASRPQPRSPLAGLLSPRWDLSAPFDTKSPLSRWNLCWTNWEEEEEEEEEQEGEEEQEEEEEEEEEEEKEKE